MRRNYMVRSDQNESKSLQPTALKGHNRVKSDHIRASRADLCAQVGSMILERTSILKGAQQHTNPLPLTRVECDLLQRALGP